MNETDICKITGLQAKDRIKIALLSLNRFRNFLPYKTNIFIVNSYILPIIDYCDVSFLDLRLQLLNKLDRLLLLIFSFHKFDHISVYRNCLKWMSIPRWHQYSICCTSFTVLCDEFCFKYLSQRFSDSFGFLSNSLPQNYFCLWKYFLKVDDQSMMCEHSFRNVFFF